MIRVPWEGAVRCKPRSRGPEHIPGVIAGFFAARPTACSATLSLLPDIILETPASPEEKHVQAKTREMHEFIDLLTSWADDMQKLGNDSLMRLPGLGRGVSRVLEFKGKATALRPRRKATDQGGST